MFTKNQSRGGLWMGLAAVLTMTSAVSAQIQGSAVEASSSISLQSANVTAPGTAAFGGFTGGLESLDWISLGYALAGVSGEPQLKGSGIIQANERAKIVLKSAAPQSPAVLFVSLDAAPKAFKGGMLVPAAPAFTVVMVTDYEGGIELSISASTNLPAGYDLVMQYAIADVAGPQGVALSNALQTSTH